MPNVIVVTLGTGSTLVTESRDAQSLQLFGQQQRMLELISIHAPSVPVIVFVYSAGPVNISDAISSPQVRLKGGKATPSNGTQSTFSGGARLFNRWGG